MKALLVVGMVLAHALQLLSQPKGIFWAFQATVNLITFSGFYFCFGYVFYLSYLTKPLEQVWRKILKTAWKTLLGYYIAAFASLFLLSRRFTGVAYELSYANLGELLTFGRVPWFTEFLLSFFLITGLVLVFFDPFKRLVQSPAALLMVSGLSLLTAMVLPVDFNAPGRLGLLIGTRSFFAFPVLQHLPVFLVGLYVAKNRIGWNAVAGGIGLVGTGAFFGYFGVHHELPSRFPPSVYWLTGSYGILYAYFLFATWLERKSLFMPTLLFIGRNSLLYLILSNILLFALAGNLPWQLPMVALGIGAGVLMVIGFLLGLVQLPPAPAPPAWTTMGGQLTAARLGKEPPSTTDSTG